jgi:cytochrome c biogenesis protein CcmG/thiol:disulfide interchange protein DsbE
LLDELGNFGIDMGVTGAPETFVVNAEGIVTYRHQGIVNEQVWQEMKGYLK